MVDKKTVQAGEESRFYKTGSDWEADRESTYVKSERRAWTGFGVMGVIAVAAVIGMASMAPFKRVVPYVFTVDKATGNVELVSATDDRAVIGYQELTDKHWAQTYVVARESYSYKLLQADYDTVLALSGDEVGREYAKQYEGTNARDKRYGQSVEMRVKVLSVTLQHDDVSTKAVVRFEKVAKKQEADSADPPQYFVSTMAFEYKPSMFGKEKDLIANPLGYRVLAYRVDAEAATPMPVVKPAATPR